MKSKIKIVTGKISSGKTTGLFNFVSKTQSVDGILAPVINDRRVLYHISSRSLKEFEVASSRHNTINIGKYHFLIESFEWANNKLIQSFKKAPEWLIIDEIGRLELMGKGLHESTSEIMGDLKNSNTNLILVIRDYLVTTALDYYNITSDSYEFLNLF